MKKVLVFDMDDTLYDEITYVKSGFNTVAKYLNKEFGIPAKKANDLMVEDLKNGRGTIFNNLLQYYNLYSKLNVQKCVAIYRTHLPKIDLDQDAKSCLIRFKSFPKYLVTDGNKVAQHNKVVALGLYKKLDKCFITHRYGVKKSKPSPYCFLKICALEKVHPAEVVYIADNPSKDFINLKPLGFKTVRILKGPFKDKVFDKDHDAHFKINSLDEIDTKFMERLFKHSFIKASR